MENELIIFECGEIKVSLPQTEANINCLIVILEGMKENYIQRPPGQEEEVMSVNHFKRKVGIDQNPRRLPADSKKKLQNVTKCNKNIKKEKGKWSKEVFDFVKDNLHLRNREIAEKINKKFGLNTTEKNLGVQMVHQGINRKKLNIRYRKAREPDIRKISPSVKKRPTTPKVGMRAIIVEEKPMTQKEINKSLKDMDPEDEDAIDEFMDPEEE